MTETTPNRRAGLFGLNHTNRDFKSVEDWSKNKFNSAFPASLACYMHSLRIKPVYLILDSNGDFVHSYIDVENLFGIDPIGDNIYFRFEGSFPAYEQLVVSNLPRIDLVTMDRHDSTPLRALEVKLTALPDDSTHHFDDSRYSSEIVVRPDTIVYLALSIALGFKNKLDELKKLFHISGLKINQWDNGDEVKPLIPKMINTLNSIMISNIESQKPLVMQPVWKTEGKKLLLHRDAFDIFVWSNFSFTRLFFQAYDAQSIRISRSERSIVWLIKMLLDFAEDGKFNHKTIIDRLSHATRNDKAFSASGRVTYQFLRSEHLLKPRIKREDLRNIILGGGQNLLSPERRLDAAILGTPGIFG